MTDQLLPCPFCGCEAKSDNGFAPLESITYVWCSNQDCYMSDGVDIGLDVEFWNTRAQPAASEPKAVECSEGTVIYLAGDTVQLGDLIGPDLEIGDRMFTNPAPAGVVLPERMVKTEISSDEYDMCADHWNACLDEVARLNGVKP